MKENIQNGLTTRDRLYIMIKQIKNRLHGEVSERSMVRHWKCRVGQPTAGSNPVLSANKKRQPIFGLLFRWRCGQVFKNLREARKVKTSSFGAGSRSICFL